MILLSTKNLFKGVHVINNRGRFGTGFTTAPVCRAGGKPSTGFPPGTRRAEPAITIFPFENSMRRHSMDDFMMNINFLRFSQNFRKIHHFSSF